MGHSFFILAIVATFRFLVLEPLSEAYASLTKYIPYVNYGVIGCAGLFALFVIIALIKAIFSPGRKK